MAGDPIMLSKTEFKKWFADILWFALLPLQAYIVQVLTIIQEPGHILTGADFIPTNATLIFIISWIGNQILNFIRKYVKSIS